MEEVIIVIKDGLGYNISETALIQDYKKEKYIPDTDKLPDWRLYLMDKQKLFQENKDEFSEKLIIREILATDYLLKLKHEHEEQS